jgi:hypothetical protein
MGAYLLWVRCVNIYPRCTLIVENDKFLAIAALAQRFGERLKDQLGVYLAGNWENFMIHGLRWMVQPARKQGGP